MSQVYCLLFLFYVTVSFVTFVHLGASIEITEAENFLVGSFGQFYFEKFQNCNAEILVPGWGGARGFKAEMMPNAMLVNW